MKEDSRAAVHHPVRLHTEDEGLCLSHESILNVPVNEIQYSIMNMSQICRQQKRT